MSRNQLVKIVKVPAGIWEAHLHACGTDEKALKDHSRWVDFAMLGYDWGEARTKCPEGYVGVEITTDDIERARLARVAAR